MEPPKVRPALKQNINPRSCSSAQQDSRVGHCARPAVALLWRQLPYSTRPHSQRSRHERSYLSGAEEVRLGDTRALYNDIFLPAMEVR